MDVRAGEKPLAWQSQPVNDEGPTYAVAKDVTARDESEPALRESERRYRLLAENATDMIGQWDPQARIVYLSGASRALLGYAPEALIGRDGYELIHPEDVAAVTAAHESLLRGAERARVVSRLRRRDGRWVWTESVARMLLDAEGRQAGIQFATRDITESKRQMDALQQAEERLRHAEAESRRARDAAERANRAKSAFLARMSHELRTPLNAIMGFAQLLELDDLTAEQRESAARIVGGGRHLIEVINDVLDISRIEAGEMAIELAPIDVGATVDAVVGLVAPLAAERRMLVRIDLDAQHAHACADGHRLKQVLLNVVSNAIKYGPAGSEVLVRTVADGERVRVSVTDAGPGIAPDEAARIFEPFERLERDAATEGTGLGLALSRNLVGAMGGEIGVRPAGDGSEFWVELQAAGAAPTPVAQERAPTRESELAGTLLYVEDTPSNAAFMRRLLRDAPGVELTVACDGASGLAAARDHGPDAIVLDMALPDIDGLAVLERLKGDPASATIPVIAVSADVAPEREAAVLEAGAVAYVQKPIEVDRFTRLLTSVMTRPPQPDA